MKDVRIYFQKLGRMKFISHLDLQRFMIRMIRMSGIPVWYSEGFNPHPYVTFALPLSLGFESTYDVLDLRLDDENYPLSQALEKLRTVMTEGINLIGIGEPQMKVGKIAWARYQIEYDELPDNLQDKLNAFFVQSQILTEKRSKKGKMNTVDLAPSIKSAKATDSTIELVLAAGGSNNLNPKLLLEAFENSRSVKLPYATVVRTMLYDAEMNEFK